MLRRSTGGLLVLATALAFPLLSASPGLAADAVGPTVQISGPDQLASGEQGVFTVDASTAVPVSPDSSVFLDVLLPSRLSTVSVQASGFSFTTTGADGTYTLTDIERGDTAVLFVAPGRFDFTRPNVGEDTHDSDVTSTERDCQDCVGGPVTLTVTGPTSHVDAGLFHLDTQL